MERKGLFPGLGVKDNGDRTMLTMAWVSFLGDRILQKLNTLH